MSVFILKYECYRVEVKIAVPAKLHLEDDEIAMYISTELIGSSVCVKIKMAEPTG